MSPYGLSTSPSPSARRLERSFEALYKRYHASLLSYCRHTLGDQDEAEDVLQQTFIRVHRALREGTKPREPRPWLYAIARNCCLSAIAARRPLAPLQDEHHTDTLSLAGLAELVRQREDLRELLAAVGRLPEDQRSALLLAELEDLPHAQIATVVGCPVSKVKALIYQARTALIADRDALNTDCRDIREQLAVARAGELRRGPLRRHLRLCAGCREFQLALGAQSRSLAAVLPVAPSAGLAGTILGQASHHAGHLAAAHTAGGAAGAASAGGAGVASAGAGVASGGIAGAGVAGGGVASGGIAGAGVAGTGAGVAGTGASAAGVGGAGAGAGTWLGGGVLTKLAVAGAVTVVAAAGAAVAHSRTHAYPHRRHYSAGPPGDSRSGGSLAAGGSVVTAGGDVITAGTGVMSDAGDQSPAGAPSGLSSSSPARGRRGESDGLDGLDGLAGIYGIAGRDGLAGRGGSDALNVSAGAGGTASGAEPAGALRADGHSPRPGEPADGDRYERAPPRTARRRARQRQPQHAREREAGAGRSTTAAHTPTKRKKTPASAKTKPSTKPKPPMALTKPKPTQPKPTPSRSASSAPAAPTPTHRKPHPSAAPGRSATGSTTGVAPTDAGSSSETGAGSGSAQEGTGTTAPAKSSGHGRHPRNQPANQSTN